MTSTKTFLFTSLSAVIVIIGIFIWSVLDEPCEPDSTKDDKKYSTDRVNSVDSYPEKYSVNNEQHPEKIADHIVTTGQTKDRGLNPEHEAPSEPTLKKAFVATRLDQGLVAVRLLGGESTLAVFDPFGQYGGLADASMEDGCSVYGYVFADQAGVPGVVVIAGEMLWSLFGNLVGISSSTTDERGRFELAVKCGKKTQLVAMHRNRGRSRVESISVEQGSYRLDLSLMPSGSIKGQITRGGIPELADLRLVSSGSDFQLDTKSDADGQYLFDSVPAGKYELVCSITINSLGEVPAPQRVEIEVHSGQTVTRDFKLGNKALVVVHLDFNQFACNNCIVDLALLDPQMAQLGAEDILSFLKSREGKKVRQILVGGDTVFEPIQFHSVEPGKYRLCAILENENPMRMVCKSLPVSEQLSVTETDLEL